MAYCLVPAPGRPGWDCCYSGVEPRLKPDCVPGRASLPCRGPWWPAPAIGRAVRLYPYVTFSRWDLPPEEPSMRESLTVIALS